MPGPPEDVSASELFQRLGESCPTEVVNFPRRTGDGKPVGTTRIQVLRSEHHDTARLNALRTIREKHKLTKDDIESPLGAAVLGDATARELLAMACLTEKATPGSENSGQPSYPRVFSSAEQVGQRLSADEVAVLFQCYLLVQAKYGPFERTIQTEQDLSRWIKRLVEGAAEFPLRHLSSVHWAEVACLLAERAYTLSAILECLFESLPSTLKSRLAVYSMGTGFFGRRAASSSETGTESSGDDEGLKISGVPVTIEDAQEMARRMKAFEEGALAELDAAEATRLKD